MCAHLSQVRRGEAYQRECARSRDRLWYARAGELLRARAVPVSELWASLSTTMLADTLCITCSSSGRCKNRQDRTHIGRARLVRCS